MPRTIAFFNRDGDLWATDGTAGGTGLVPNIIPGPNGSYPGNDTGFAATKNGIVFSAEVSVTGQTELFVSDGTQAGTREIVGSFVQYTATGELGPEPVNSLTDFTSLGNGRALFSGSIDPAASQLWSTDGTAQGTVLVKSIAAGYITPTGGGKAITEVSSSDPATAGVWSTDGTAAGTVRISPETSFERVYSLGNGKALFQPQSNIAGHPLMGTDGTLAGTVSIGPFPTGILDFAATSTGLGLFAASPTPTEGEELWVSDGTAAGTTRLVQGPAPGPQGNQGFLPLYLTPVGGGRVLFAANDGTGETALWVSNGTAAGTALVKELAPSDTTHIITGITALANGKALVTLQDSSTRVVMLLATDGTAAGTAPLQSFAAYITPAGSNGPVPSFGNAAALPNGTAVFTIADGRTNFQVWRTDGTAAGTVQLADVAQNALDVVPTFTVLPDGRAVFEVRSADGTSTLWATGGTAAGTGPVASPAATGFVYVNTPTAASTVTVPDADPRFNSDYYNAANPDVAAAGLNAAQHYAAYGSHEGRSPDPFFDGNYYLTQNPDVAKSGMNPLTHFELYGWHEGRAPSLLFSVYKYDAAYHDVAASGLDPLAHYLLYGQAEGRMTFLTGGMKPADPLVNASFYDKQLGATLIPTGTAAAQQAAASYDATGWQKGLNPDTLFDTNYYLAHNPDVAAAHVDPLLHYEQFGSHEGRNPSAAFSTNGYLQHNADVATAGADPLLHYVVYGQAEGRAIYPA